MVLNQTPPTGRMEWMDLLRGLAVLLVVAWHAVSIPEQFGGKETSDALQSFNAAVAPFRIPTLLVLSGLLLERSLSKGPRRYVVGKVRHIVWPYALWFVLIMGSIDSLVALTNPTNWLSGGILWYLAVLIVCYAVAMLRPRWLPWELFVLAPLVLLWALEPESGVPQRLRWFGAFFFLGAALRPHLDTLQRRLPAWGGALLGPVVVLGGVAAAERFVISQRPAYFVVSVLGILFALWLAPRIPSSAVTRLLQWYGRNSIVVYVGHALAVYLTYRVLAAIGAGESGIVVPVLAIAGVGVPTLLILARRRLDLLFVFPELRVPTNHAPRHLAEARS